ncbi:amino acid adenylation domain-containing protein [Paenibacillus barcinonensis]|uniref:non-ribosomal peptide synthetase n=1 Tax=Paenibacillus barcinonensis TaxID=198119 RepID=UPI001C128C2B|nr:non-ribosomal peptide synthetase [Paenibacillus barcinonensis]MBU5354621.1 amino acid adenylation domain-containing protein [Paenibacillus barcinonensis]
MKKSGAILNKRQLVDQILSQMNVSETIERISREDNRFPLSFAQKRLWLQQQIDPASTAYNMMFANDIRGPFEPEAFEQAIHLLVQRQEALQIRIDAEAGIPYQCIEHDKPDYQFVDVSMYSNAQAEQHIAELIERANGPFDFTHDPLCKFRLFRLDQQRYIFVLMMHHIISDGQSIEIIQRDLLSYYEYFRGAGPLQTFDAFAAQYIDYSVWQNQMLDRSSFMKQKQYWIEQLKGHSYTLNLPCDRERPAKPSEEGISVHFTVPAAITHKLKSISQTHHSTLFMVMYTCFAILLRKYSGETDLLIGTPVSNRPQPDLEKVVGFFVNTLVLRSRIHDQQSYLDQLKQSRNTILDAFDHQDVPIDLLFDDLIQTRNVGYSPLFQVMFSLGRAAHVQQQDRQTEFKGMQFKPVSTSKFDMSLDMTEEEEVIRGTFECRADLFDVSTIERWIGNFLTLLQDIAERPEQPISTLSVVSAEERQQLLCEWNNTYMDYPDDRCVHHLFEASVSRYPDHAAVVYGTASLTYEELDRRANQLAHVLIEHGIGPDKAVAIGIERSLHLPVALLAVLKAGGAIVPLDLDAPIERNRHMILDSEASICLINTHTLPIPNDAAVLIDVSRPELVHNKPVDAPPSQVGPDHLIAIYYTSGTTGKPKGVSVRHQGWVSRIWWMQQQFKLRHDETVLQKTTLTFDDVGLEYFWTWMAGARVALLEPGFHRDPYAIIEALKKYKVGIVFFVPSMLKMLIQRVGRSDLEQLHALRDVFSSGEALKPEMVQSFHRHLPGLRLHNSYGVTEVSIDSTVNINVQSDPGLASRNVSIGRPIGNNFIYVLDELQQPVPIGVQGHLYIGGVGLARGYYRDPVKTAQAFFTNPFTEGRMYKTGDMAYYDASGELYIVGRMDNQLKIRGMRVELGEISDVISRHADIQECAVLAEKWGDDEELSLSAYIQLTSSSIMTSTDLRSYCRTLLPSHMIPSRFFTIDQIPLNSNGKVDKSALKQLDSSLLQDGIAAPQDELEEKIMQIFMEILDMESVQLHESFFDQGGHSIKAIRLVDMLNSTFQTQLSVLTLFDHSTVIEIARLIREGMSDKHQSIVVLKESARKQDNPLFLVPTGGGNLINYYELVSQIENLTICGFIPKGYDSHEEPLYSVQSIARYYYSVLTKWKPQGPYRVLGWSFGGNVAFELARLIEEAGQELEWLIILDAPARSHQQVVRPMNRVQALNELARNNGYELKTDDTYEEQLAELLSYFPDKTSVGNLKVRIANEVAFDNYYSSEPIQSDIHLLYAVNQDETSPVPLTDAPSWHAKTTGSCAATPIPGHHENLIDTTHAVNVAQYVNQLVKEASKDF